MFFVFVFQSAVGRCMFVEHKVISRAICSSARFGLLFYLYDFEDQLLGFISDGFSHKLSEKTVITRIPSSFTCK